MSIAPYLHFQGNCREAMAAYQKVLGGKLDIMGYDQMPDAPPAMAKSDRVLHSALMSPLGDLAASDFAPGTTGDPQKAVSVSLEAPTYAEAERINNALAEGGEIIAPFGPAFFTPGFGMFKDRFGTHWIITTTPETT